MRDTLTDVMFNPLGEYVTLVLDDGEDGKTSTFAVLRIWVYRAASKLMTVKW